MYFKKTGFFAIILRDCSRASEAGRSEISRVGLRLPTAPQGERFSAITWWSNAIKWSNFPKRIPPYLSVH